MHRFMAPDVAGVVRLGATDDVAERSLPDLLRRFSSTQCCVSVDVVVDSSARLKQRVRKGELDLTLVTCNPKAKHNKDMEIVFRERLAWAGARNGVAFEKTPLPISVWEEGCSWRDEALASLDSIGREYRLAFMSAHISGQRAAILADLAIAPIPVSCCVNGIVDLTGKADLPVLNDYAMALIVAKKPSAAVKAAAQHLRESLTVH